MKSDPETLIKRAAEAEQEMRQTLAAIGLTWAIGDVLRVVDAWTARDTQQRPWWWWAAWYARQIQNNYDDMYGGETVEQDNEHNIERGTE